MKLRTLVCREEPSARNELLNGNIERAALGAVHAHTQNEHSLRSDWEKIFWFMWILYSWVIPIFTFSTCVRAVALWAHSDRAFEINAINQKQVSKNRWIVESKWVECGCSFSTFFFCLIFFFDVVFACTFPWNYFSVHCSSVIDPATWTHFFFHIHSASILTHAGTSCHVSHTVRHLREIAWHCIASEVKASKSDKY